MSLTFIEMIREVLAEHPFEDESLTAVRLYDRLAPESKRSLTIACLYARAKATRYVHKDTGEPPSEEVRWRLSEKVYDGMDAELRRYTLTQGIGMVLEQQRELDAQAGDPLVPDGSLRRREEVGEVLDLPTAMEHGAGGGDPDEGWE